MADGHDHGHTAAAWTGVCIALIGFTVSGVYMILAQPLGFWLGLVLVAAAGGVSALMKSAGMGKKYTSQPVRMAGE